MCKITHKNTQLRLNLFIPCGLVDPDSKTSIAWTRAPLLWRFLAEERATFVLKTWKRQLWKHQQIMKDLEEGQKSNKKFSIPLCSSAEWKRGVWFGPTKCGQNAGASINKESQSWEGIDLDLLQCVLQQPWKAPHSKAASHSPSRCRREGRTSTEVIKEGREKRWRWRLDTQRLGLGTVRWLGRRCLEKRQAGWEQGEWSQH